ncbi:MAG: hypothetical protein BWY06_03392 [Candidatus Latescibacteria bacterium ADurb.Bin168]|nr:MAG: hypothetical protein BWY06_03392 [Candidatus Latescibacteria bacterium ADurb.Bin168]
MDAASVLSGARRGDQVRSVKKPALHVPQRVEHSEPVLYRCSEGSVVLSTELKIRHREPVIYVDLGSGCCGLPKLREVIVEVERSLLRIILKLFGNLHGGDGQLFLRCVLLHYGGFVHVGCRRRCGKPEIPAADSIHKREIEPVQNSGVGPFLPPDELCLRHGAERGYLLPLLLC